MTGDFDAVDTFAAQARRLLVEQHHATPADADEQVRNIERYTRARHSGNGHVRVDSVKGNGKAERDAAIKKARADGVPVKAIAKQYGLSAQGVYSVGR